MIHTSSSLADTEKLATLFVGYLSSRPVSSTVPNVFGFSGDLGSGKTAFAKCVAKLLGIDDHITSPTFVIEKIYPYGPGNAKRLIHIDAYRLESADELLSLGFERDAANPANLILVEWPERVLEALPANTPIIRFSFVSEHVRTIEFPDMMGI